MSRAHGLSILLCSLHGICLSCRLATLLFWRWLQHFLDITFLRPHLETEKRTFSSCIYFLFLFFFFFFFLIKENLFLLLHWPESCHKPKPDHSQGSWSLQDLLKSVLSSNVDWLFKFIKIKQNYRFISSVAQTTFQVLLYWMVQIQNIFISTESSVGQCWPWFTLWTFQNYIHSKTFSRLPSSLPGTSTGWIGTVSDSNSTLVWLLVFRYTIALHKWHVSCMCEKE